MRIPGWAAVQHRADLLGDALRLVADAGGPLIRMMALVAVSGLIPVASVYVTRGVVDRLAIAMASHGASADVIRLSIWAVVAGTLILAGHATGGVLDWMRTRHEEHLKDRITARIHEQSARLDLAFYESPAFFDALHRAREEARYRPAELSHAVIDGVQAVVTLAGLMALLFSFGPWLPLLLLAGAIPILFVGVGQATRQQQWRREHTTDERRAWYYDYALTSAEFASELRVFGWAPRLQAAFQRLRERIREQRLRLARRRVVAETLASASGLGILAAAFIWIVRRALAGAVSLGQLAAFGQAFATGFAAMRALVGAIGRVYANSLFIEDLTQFLALTPAIGSPPAPVHVARTVVSGIRFRDVTFRYPGASASALRGFDLFVPARGRVAIVGPNGAGKSTIIKLICRLYDPDSGSIEIDGVDIRRFEPAALRALIAPLFQQPVHYCESVAGNIGIGAGGPGGPGESLAAIDLQRASEAAGASTLIEGLPRGYDTQLGKWFDEGTELSAGEWQRVALARTLARQAPIVVVDEPTSALDPWSEADWYRRFSDAVGERTAIVITHRLTTAMQADTIHVMADGRIVESGTHESLMAQSGYYARAWLTRPALA